MNDSVAANRCSAASTLSDRAFTVSGNTVNIDSIMIRSDSSLVFDLDNTSYATAPGLVLADYTLYVDDVPFEMKDAGRSCAWNCARWVNPGLSWSAGDTVQLRLNASTWTGVEIFGGDLVRTPGGYQDLNIASEGGSATFQVKLTRIPSANVTVSLERNWTRCSGCGNEYHGDVNAATVSPATLTFTDSNYSTGQTVTVTGVPDSDGIHEHLLVWARVSIASDANPNDPYRSPLRINGVFVTITDGTDDGSDHGGL